MATIVKEDDMGTTPQWLWVLVMRGVLVGGVLFVFTPILWPFVVFIGGGIFRFWFGG